MKTPRPRRDPQNLTRRQIEARLALWRAWMAAAIAAAAAAGVIAGILLDNRWLMAAPLALLVLLPLLAHLSDILTRKPSGSEAVGQKNKPSSSEAAGQPKKPEGEDQ